MAKINILPAKVYNRIAAGEVVERPYSVVKELVENAIDAGATEIEIYVEQGGKQLIRVIDNGCGIARDDLQSAFLPHATSKIEKAEDLDNILTLGFRGEAVASIAAVSQMTITSRVEGEPCYSLTSNGGEMGLIKEDNGLKGTCVEVKSLFFNAPVRLKFLKSDKAEEADITTFVSRFILNRYDIAFTYYVNGKKILQSFGGGMEEAFVCVYGASARAQCIEIDAQKHGVHIRGYIGNQNFSKPNKSYQSVFLNGRYVLNATISSAISGAYSAYLMKRQYPFYVLHITLPTEIVDVNVHPNKSDVRFADNKIVYGCIYSVISSILDGKSDALSYIVNGKAVNETETEVGINDYNERFSDLGGVKAFSNEEEGERKTLSEKILEQDNTEETLSSQPKNSEDAVFGFETLTYEQARKEIESCSPEFVAQKTKKKPFTPTSLSPIPHENGFIPIEIIEQLDEPKNVVLKTEEEFSNPKRCKPRKNNEPPKKLLELFPGSVYKPPVILRLDDPDGENSNDKALDEKDYFEENKRYLASLDEKAKQDKIDVSSCEYVGKLFNTYLLYQKDGELLIIDQHAAHERLLFDKLKARMQNRERIYQPMLVPYDLKLNAFEATFIRERLEDIRSMGFEIEEYGETNFKVKAVPVDIPKIDVAVFFNHILGEVHSLRAIKMEDILKDKLAQAACKAAIKGGMDISRAEIDELFKQMDGNMGLKCPHGRPVVVKITKTELEKMFKRIV
ncbi:MAG: DNA mismatch repair endonuclease MutL [Clostridiales bacterium]|nr:DNA mismatch repair endonuclease MutL [Clostridiales bacterium]